jgi:hypothetical protein
MNQGERVSDLSDLLRESPLTDPIGARVEVESRLFKSRLECSMYLRKQFEEGKFEPGDADAGLWAWLSVFYFDQLCPPGPAGRIHPGEESRWIPSPRWDRYYRHLLAGPYFVYLTYRRAPEKAKILLWGPLDKPGDYFGQLAARQDFVSNPTVMEAATRLFFDEAEGKPKRGMAPNEHRPGTLRRFVDLLQQLDVTHDLYSMDCDSLLRILPGEFKK